MNDEKITMVALDGDNPVSIAQADFPKTKVMTLPNMTDFSQVLVTVASGKADITIVDANTFGTYNEHNPGKLKIVDAAKPIRVFPASFGFPAGEPVLRDAVNAALDELILRRHHRPHFRPICKIRQRDLPRHCPLPESVWEIERPVDRAEAKG
ncbi:MAG: transporter substrate-binding domain-containing protein [Alphaproteobacteria bacterium]